MLETGDYGSENGILPCGLTSRNTLRLESAMSLYGHELGEDISPLEANLGWICKLNKGDFIGREALPQTKRTRTGQKACRLRNDRTGDRPRWFSGNH